MEQLGRMSDQDNVEQIIRAAKRAGMKSAVLDELGLLLKKLSKETSKLAFLR